MTDTCFGEFTGHQNVRYEILGDPQCRRIWINAEDGSAVARFNVARGVDIHNSASSQLNGAPECLWCTHERPDHATWLLFIQKIKEHFGLHIALDAIDINLLKS